MRVPPVSSRLRLDAYAAGVPAEIDEPTQTLPEMLSASVKAFGRRPTAALDVDALRDFCRTRLTPYKVLRRQVCDQLLEDRGAAS